MVSIEFLNYVGVQFSIYFGIFTLLAGIIGDICNIIVLLSLKTFRENSCAFYLTAISFVNLGQLIFSLLPRILNFWFAIDWSISSLFYCKFRTFFFQACSLTSFTCMCLATIDQYLATCSKPSWQRYSSIKFAYRFSVIVIIIWILHGVPILVYYNHIPSSGNDSYVCASSSVQFQNYWTYGYILVLICCLPVLFTGIFGLLAYQNVSQLAYRVVPLVRRELDKQLTIMVLVQVVFNLCVLVPYIATYMVNLGVNVNTKSYSYAQLQLARSITVAFYYWYFAGPFYVYFCVSERFRKQFIHVFSGFYLSLRPQRRVDRNQTASNE